MKAEIDGIEKMPGPLKFAEIFFLQFVRVTFCIPFVFIFLKAVSFNPVSNHVSNMLIDLLSFVYPVLPEQYGAVRRINGDAEAANYALFALVMTVAVLSSIVRVVLESIKNAKSIRETSVREIVFAVVFAATAIAVVLFFDISTTPENAPKKSFFVDDSGVYYLRQFFVLTLLCYALLLLAAAIVKNFPTSRYTSSPSS